MEYCLRQEVHNTFTHLDDMFPRDALVEIQVVAGRLRPIFDTVNRHSVFDCNCDNFRSKINFAFDSPSMTSPFFDTNEDDTDEMSSDFVDPLTFLFLINIFGSISHHCICLPCFLKMYE